MCCLRWFYLVLLITIPDQTANSFNLGNFNSNNNLDDEKGLFPPTLNLAANAIITVNATCGQNGHEVFCKLVEHVFMREPQCGVCDDNSLDPKKRHPISNAIDGTNSWWQSPTLQNGKKYEWVTITLDLRQVYQVAYVIVKAANSPRPGNWILERSRDGINYKPWQYYAISDSDCLEIYGIPSTYGIPRYISDDEVICTSYYSKLNPLENGEIHTSLVNGRPGATGPSDTLQEFTAARYVRLRMQRIRTLNADLMTLSSSDPQYIDKSVTRRYFYSIKDISIGGQCKCFGHARDCPEDPISGRLKCRCVHNTCGNTCEKCCPLYNQKAWRLGTSTDAGICEKCQCFGHADECFYDAGVAERGESVNIEGKHEGGGVCINCKHFTTGINCEQCIDGYYRPLGVSRSSSSPCVKCQCDATGAVGHCVKDDSRQIEGYNPGDCICREGFAGPQCERCARGYRRYPYCEPCPCNFAGTVNMDCEGECVCKKNVEGMRCDRCKPNHFSLDEHNPDGCTPCYCFGVSSRCESAQLVAESISGTRGWKIMDLPGKRVVRPTEENGHFTIANDDMLGHDVYYWLGPQEFLGHKLNSYGSRIQFSVSWVKARGDSAGKHLRAPDIVLEGNGIRIAYGNKTHHGSDNSTEKVLLVERGWWQIPFDEPGSPTELLRKHHRSSKVKPVTRKEFMQVLNNITRVLVRAKYHTDQIEGSLHSVVMEVGSATAVGIRKLKNVEKCQCPPGYSGLSCEACEEGYRRVNNTLYNGECRKCDCHNHATVCNPYTGICLNCQHNTHGDHCELCLPGFHGNAKIGTRDDCQACACPLAEPSNNFSPTCRDIPGYDDDYVCDACPVGYTGDKCQMCSDGFFGNPMIPGNYCYPCSCSGNVDLSLPGNCDPMTGQCLRCLDNTGGWNCDECKEGYYGNALVRTCKLCECNLYGSLSTNCDRRTGQCQCKHNYIGKNCERCAENFGNIAADCQPCSCDAIGSTSPRCDPISAQCDCKPGVFGAKCDSCLDSFYGFSSSGCIWCGCDSKGSIGTGCDVDTGDCVCKPHVEGRTCDRCQPNYWNLISGSGCESCDCNPIGSIGAGCDAETGQCRCKTGVGGRKCDKCRPNYFGFSIVGCKQCDPCDTPGRLCHPKSGECVCPPNTEGRSCERCRLNTWGYDALEGCKPCDCNIDGSEKLQCNPLTGQCECMEGYEGEKCNLCRFGFFEFPNCKRCRCHEEGTETSKCNIIGDCECDETGQCPCKVNVEGKKCRKCKEGTFGLLASHPRGCFECFCFGKSTKCSQSQFVWTQLALPDRRDVVSEHGDMNFNVTNGLRVIPGRRGGVAVGLRYVLDSPLYWELPDMFLGDKVTSYNGRLSFTVSSDAVQRFPSPVLHTYPVVQIQGNFRIVLEHYVASLPPNGHYEVRLHEDFWKVKNNHHASVTRSLMMVALQNIQHILIRATDSADFQTASLYDVKLDVAVPVPGHSPTAAIGVEICECPPEYNGTSCQDPATGYYRKRKPDFLDSKDILDLVGIAVPCDCNRRSNICDKETGFCLNCRDNTGGPFCNLCALGFYGDPAVAPCIPCACPTFTNSFSDMCIADVFGGYVCTNCRPGYTGRHCERCDNGYYGNPTEPGGECKPCDCDPRGSLSTTCDPVSGQCFCFEGITGRNCSECAPRYTIVSTGCKSCDDECVGTLLDDVDYLIDILDKTNLTGAVAAPWNRYYEFRNDTGRLKERVDGYKGLMQLGRRLIQDFTTYDIEGQANLLFQKAHNVIMETAPNVSNHAQKKKIEAETVLKDLLQLRTDIDDMLERLHKYAQGESLWSPNLDTALAEAENNLDEIRAKNFLMGREKAEREIEKAEMLLKRLQDLLVDGVRLKDLRSKLEKLNTKLKQIEVIVKEQVFPFVHNANNLSQINRERLNTTKGTLLHAEQIHKEIMQITDDSGELLNEGQDGLTDARTNYKELQMLYNELGNLTIRVEEREGILARHNALYEEAYVKAAQAHANSLMQQANEILTMFNATREISAQPLEAVGVYENIVVALQSARDAATAARTKASKANKVAYPSAGKSLSNITKESKIKSRILSLKSQDLKKNKTLTLRRHLVEENAKLNNIEIMNEKVEEDLRMINSEMGKLHKNLKPKAEEVKQNLTEMNIKGVRLAKKVDKIEDKTKDLRKKLDSISLGTSAGVGNLSREIEKARDDIITSDRIAKNLNNTVASLRQRNEEMLANMSKIRSIILQARQRASSIKVSLNDNNGECMRSYRPDIEPTTTSNIVLNYAISTEVQNSSLLYLASSKDEDFMAIEMVNRRIRFIWNVGGGTQMIEHRLQIETNDEDLLKDENWYKIEVNRVNNFGFLSVTKTPESGKLDPNRESGTSKPGFVKMDLDSTSYFYIGGYPPNTKKPPEILTTGFAGCLHELFLDGKRIGLWNFLTTSGCRGCKEGATEEADSSIAKFSGEGYAILPQIKNLQKKSYRIQLTFKSFDEDALLFFSGNPILKDYVSLELKSGRIIFRIKFGETSAVNITSAKKYNTGNWTKVSGVVRETTGVLLMNDAEEELEAGANPAEKSGLDIKDNDVYFGGVPPNFTKKDWDTQTNFSPFLGCMKNIQLDRSIINLFKGSAFGIEAGCKDKDLRVVWFGGEGFVEVNGQTLPREANFAFSFQTMENSGLMMLSTFVGKSKKIRKEFTDFYSVSIEDGKVNIWIDAGDGTAKISSVKKVNDGAFHTISLIKTTRRIEVRIDDQPISSDTKLPQGPGSPTVESPSEGGLFFGGFSEEVKESKVKEMAASSKFFNGSITDVIFNDKLINFNTPVKFSKVGIGRIKPLITTKTTAMVPAVTPSLVLNKCMDTGQLNVESRAVKLGDKPNSHVKIEIKRNDLMKEFNITFEFRTFYPNGMLIFMKNAGKRQTHLALALRDSRVILTIQAKDKQKHELKTENGLNNGSWRKVTIYRFKRKISITVDNLKPVETKVRKFQVHPPIYLGGIAENMKIPDHLVVESFKGCIKNFEFKGKTLDLAREVIVGGGQCFAKVGRGAYFPGDAFAIYEKSFSVGAKMDISLEFKTNRKNGILLSISEDGGSPALALELNEGNVTITVDMGDKQHFSAVQSFPTSFQICDNKWHVIKASYVKNAVTVKVDKLNETFGFSKDSTYLSTNTSGPLYIGGLPEDVSNGVLRNRANFYGCIRFLSINENRRDWTDMSYRHNVLLNSCPDV